MGSRPLVSCIMPTRDRRQFVPRAVACFLAQDYDDRELVVVDDGAEPVADLLPPDPRIRYLRLEGPPLSIGAKRNRACAAAAGELIAHWDDDDWSAPGRLSYQIEALLATDADACGLAKVCFLDAGRGLAWRFTSSAGQVVGGTLCYRRRAWERRPFDDVRVGEDVRFVGRLAPGRLLRLEDDRRYVACVHAGNTSRKRTASPRYESCPAASVEALMAWSPAAIVPAPRPMWDRHVELSLVIPAHPEGAALVRRTVLSLDAQTAEHRRYEVVIAVDGGDVEALRRAVEPERRRVLVTLVPSPRGQDATLPHRNHARNAGARVARGRWIWFLDGDFLLPPHAVAHVFSALEQSPRTTVLTPTLAGIDEEPATWLNRSAVWAAGDGGGLDALVAGCGLRLHEYAGYAERYRPGPPRAEPCPGLREGFPCLPAALFHALGGFDEALVGWGANKEELVMRLRALAETGLVDLRLLTSVRAFHQPHAPDPGRARGSPLRAENARRLALRSEEVEAEAGWWRDQRARALAVLRGERPDAASVLAQQSPVPWVVLIFAHDQPESLLALLVQLAEEAGGRAVEVRVYDNGSTRDQRASEAFCARQGWSFVRAREHHPKATLWRLWDTAFRSLSSLQPDALVVVLTDQIRLLPGFFDRCTEAWAAVQDPEKAALTLVVDPARAQSPCWTGVAPRRENGAWRTQWVDEVFVAGRRFFQILGFGVPPVSPRRWARDPALSSGIGRGMSLRLHGAGLGLYRVEGDLVERTGDRASLAVPAPVAAPATPGGPPFVVLVLTYQRPHLLDRLLDDLEREQASGQRLEVRVYDDASEADYRGIRARLAARGWHYRRADHRHGKQQLWRWVARAFADLRSFPSDSLFVMLPDDCRLATAFFARARRLWEGIEDPRKATLNVLVDASREHRASWTGVAPQVVGEVVRTQWVDLAFLADERFFAAIDYTVAPVPAERWRKNADRSSGVGEWLSVHLDRQGLGQYRVRESLIAHVEARSELFPEMRVAEPLFTSSFADGPEAARRLGRQAPVVASLATIPGREDSLARTVASLLPQVDRLRVYLNGHAQPPACLEDARIEVAWSRDHGDRGDAGKFFWCDEAADQYVFSCDDDIVYPPDYVSHLVMAIERYRRRVVVGLHGIILERRVRSYYRDRQVFHCARHQGVDRPVHLVGTGCAAWHSSAIRLRSSLFPIPNMADIWLGLACQRQGVPAVALAHPGGWLEVQPVTDSIFDRFRDRDGEQTRVVNSHRAWRILDPEQRSREGVRRRA